MKSRLSWKLYFNSRTDMFIRILILVSLFSLVEISRAQSSGSSPTPRAPSLEQRVADLEAYMKNSARGADATNASVGSNISGPGPGHNAWMMTAAALVLFMTLPGLALFYGGLVRGKNVLSILAQCLGIAGLVAILWWAVGYSLVFSHGSPFFGSLRFAFLRGVDAQPNGDYSYWISQNVFSMYQLMFAIITPARISTRSHGDAQHGPLHGWRGNALGRLVRFQRRQRPWRGRYRRERIHDDDSRDGDRFIYLGDARVRAARQAERPRILFRRGWWPGGNYTRVWICRFNRRGDYWYLRGHRSFLRLHEIKVTARLR